LLLLVGLDYILIVFVEVVVGLYNFRSHTVIATYSLSNTLVLLRAFLIQDDENQIETGKKGVRHAYVLSWS
jgi:hypothetical protein